MATEARSTRPGTILFHCSVVAIIEGFDLQAAGVAAPRLAPALGLSPGQLVLFFSAATLRLIFGARRRPGPLLAGLLVAGGRSPVQVLMALIPFALASGIATFMLVRKPAPRQNISS